LVRRRCPDAGNPIPVAGAIQAMIDNQFADLPAAYKNALPKTDKIFGIAPSPECANGTRGRVGVFEMLPTSKEMERTILTNPVEEELYKVARAGGMLSMKEDAIIKMLETTIPFEEVNTLGGDMLEDPDSQKTT
jgi:type II secretory ATPase GspE/PulE/Tfp pilus assembly ATPase PilB-like protein